MRLSVCIAGILTGALLGGTFAWAEADSAAGFVDRVLPGIAERDRLVAALEDGGENWPQLAAALEQFNTEEDGRLASTVWLITNAPHLDRLELTTDVLVKTVNLSHSQAQHDGYDLAGDFFKRNILNYRLDDEPVTDWRLVLNGRYAPFVADEPEPAYKIRLLVDEIADNFRIVERGYYGNIADPVSIDNARAGTGRELALLTAAALRSVGFGTRFVREDRSSASWVEVYTGSAAGYDPAGWTPVYPAAPDQTGNTDYAVELCGGRIAVVTAGDAFGREQVTSRYSDVCAVLPRFLSAGEQQDSFEHWSVTAWGQGTWKPLDDLGYPTADVDYPLTLGPEAGEVAGDVYYVGAPGEYRLQAGVRYPGGTVHYLSSDFSAEPGDTVSVELALDAPLELPAHALVERRLPAELPEIYSWLATGTHLVVIRDGGEPSLRTLSLLEQYTDGPGLEYQVYSSTAAVDEERALLLDAFKLKDDDQLPVVILVREGETLLYLRGYNLNIADWVARVLGTASD